MRRVEITYFFLLNFSSAFFIFFYSLYRRSDTGKAFFFARAKRENITKQSREVRLPDATHLRSASQFYEYFKAINLKAPI